MIKNDFDYKDVKVMGILNITPDSFSDGGKNFKIEDSVRSAKKLIAQGADIIDIGGESTRPGAPIINLEEELRRVIPVIEALREFTDIDISIDTSKPEVMKKSIEAGANIVNDVKALSEVASMEMVANLNTDVCLMHMSGNPKTMQQNPNYVDVVDEIKMFFENKVNECLKAGIKESKIILDPGFGFGKTLEHNITILKRLDELKELGMPILVGISRKSMIGELLGDRSVDGRISGSVMAGMIAIQNGANIIRVHDVLETKDALTIMQRIV